MKNLFLLLSLILFGCVSGGGEGEGSSLSSANQAETTEDTETPVCDSSDNTVSDIIRGSFPTQPCVVKEGKVKCWGHNHNGTLGLGDFDSRGDDSYEMGSCLEYIDLGSDNLTVKSVHGTNRASRCALFNNGKVKCWGKNVNGELGLGHLDVIGDDPMDMGSNLPFVDLGAGSVKQLAAGQAHYCALFNSGKVKCWGNFADNGDNPTSPFYVGDDSTDMGNNLSYVDLGGKSAVSISPDFAILSDGTLYRMDIHENPSSYLPPVGAVDLGTGKTAIAVSSGKTHVCVILNDNSLKCLGKTSILGVEKEGIETSMYGEILGDDPSELGDNLPTIKLGTNRSVKYVDAGASHTCAILDNNDLKCWGHVRYGPLGVDLGSPGVFPCAKEISNHTIGDEPNEMGDSLQSVNLGSGRYALSVNAQASSTCALLDNNEVKCWGNSYQGSLGFPYEDECIGIDQSQMGDSLESINL